MKYLYCTDCKLVFPEEDIGTKPEKWIGEYWGAKFTQTDCYPCCPECGSEEIEEANYCPCGMGIRPTEKFCENHIDSLNDIKKDVRALFPNINTIEETTVEEYLVDNLFPRLTPMEWKDGGWEL